MKETKTQVSWSQWSCGCGAATVELSWFQSRGSGECAGSLTTDRSPELFARGQSHQRPPGRDSKSQQGRNGVCLGAEGGVYGWGGRFRESHVTPAPKPDSRNGSTTQGVLPRYSGHSPDTGCEDPA